VPRFAALNAVANGQPLWAQNEPQMTALTIPFLGPERASWQYPFNSLLRSGAHLCFGSDWPVSTPDVMSQVHVAVNRAAPFEGRNGTGPEPFLPDERVTLETALRAFTMGSAYVNHLDAETGSVTVGKRADVTVLDSDVFALPSSRSGEVRVDLTVADGAVVFRRS
jgi:predicted amidohydrolase YtcJ